MSWLLAVVERSISGAPQPRIAGVWIDVGASDSPPAEFGRTVRQRYRQVRRRIGSATVASTGARFVSLRDGTMACTSLSASRGLWFRQRPSYHGHARAKVVLHACRERVAAVMVAPRAGLER